MKVTANDVAVASYKPVWLKLPDVVLSKRSVGLLLTFTFASWLWRTPPLDPLDESGMRFLATMVAAVGLWMFEVFDDYIVGLALLFSWIVFNIVPADAALAGFSHSAWFFTVGALGMGAAVSQSGVLHRLALQLLRRVPRNHRLYSIIFTVSGPFVTALIPEVKGRVVMLCPLAQAVSEAMGFAPRSNASARLAFAAYIGFTQVTFMFITGSTYCLVGWSILPEAAKADFDWVTWAIAALPAGLVTLFSLFTAVEFLFPVGNSKHTVLPAKRIADQLANLGRVHRNEWISLTVITLALVGWITKPVHGVAEAWIALGGLLAFLLTGALDKKGLKDGIDWGIVLFFGVVYGMGGVCSYLKIDRWLFEWLNPMILTVSFHPVAFLVLVLLLSFLVRFFLVKAPAVIVLGLILLSPAQEMGIHPGVLILTILLGIETWFLPYQNPSYLLTYQVTHGKAFSHSQARKLMFAKFFVSFLALLISIPYWRLLGFIS